MNKKLKLAVTGLGNNISALLQGINYYRHLEESGKDTKKLPGIRHYQIGNISVHDIEIVAGFEIQEQKIGKAISSAIFELPNNYPSLGVDIMGGDNLVSRGLVKNKIDGEGEYIKGRKQVVDKLKESGAELLLYSLPTGMQWAADTYAECALEAGVGFVNCTPEVVARNEKLLNKFESKGLSLIGDDLASHMGTSMVHRSLLYLLVDRGLTLEDSYQLNFGGNEDFRNLFTNGSSKAVSKKNALLQPGLDADKIHVIPSAGYVPHLCDRKIAYLNLKGRGWANTPVNIELKLEVQDSSNAAGVIIDLIRIAAVSQRLGLKGFNAASASFLKSPPGGHDLYDKSAELSAFEFLNEDMQTTLSQTYN